MSGGLRSAAAGEIDVASSDGIEGLAEEWDELALGAGSSPFVRPGWLRAWWSAFGEGELRVFTQRRGEELTAVLPLYRRGARLHACANVHSPVFDPPGEGQGLEELLRAALSEARGVLVLSQLDRGGALAAAANRLAEAGECSLVSLDTRVASRIAAVSWAEYEGALRSKRRRENRRRERKLAELGRVHHEVLDDSAASARFDEFLQLEATDWKTAQGTAIRQSSEARSLYANLLSWGVDAGIARVSFMYLDDRPVATHITLDGGNRRYMLKTGFDTEFARYSVGLIHMLMEVHDALDAGLEIELGLGDEPLKQELRNGTWPLRSIALFPATVRGRLNRPLVATRAAARRRARQSALLRRGRDALRGWRAG